MDPTTHPEPQSNWPPPGALPPPVGDGRPLPHVERGRNGFSIAGLVLGIVPLFGGILGIVFGLIGRSQSTQRGQQGRVMGTWGAALGAVWLVVIVAIFAAGVANAPDDAHRGDDGQVTAPGKGSTLALHIGDCVRTVPAESASVADVDLVRCTSAHGGEVYAQPALTGSAYPGDKSLSRQAERMCVSEFQTFVGKAYDDSTLDLYYFRPTSQSWDQGDRKVDCLVGGKGLVGTMKGSRR